MRRGPFERLNGIRFYRMRRSRPVRWIRFVGETAFSIVFFLVGSAIIFGCWILTLIGRSSRFCDRILKGRAK